MGKFRKKLGPPFGLSEKEGFSKNLFVLVFVSFFLSRFLFLANFPHFYDSPEYFRESLSSNFLFSILNSHESVHPIYLFLTQFFQNVFPGSNVWEVSLVSAVFGFATFYLFFLLIKRIKGKKIAFFSLIPLILFKHLWLVQTNILHESVDHFFLIAGILFFDNFLEKKRPGFFILSVLLWSLAVFNFVGVILWFMSILSFVCLREKSKTKEYLYVFIGIFLSFLVGIVLSNHLFNLSGISGPGRLAVLLKDYGLNTIFRGFSLPDLLRIFRNLGFILIDGYTPVSLFSILIFTFLTIRSRDKKQYLFSLFFLLPFFISGKFWYGGAFGRYSSFIAYYLAVVFSYLALKYPRIYWSMIVILFIFFVSSLVTYEKTPVAVVQEKLIRELDIKDTETIVLSDYQRPQLETVFDNAIYTVSDSEASKRMEESISEKLDRKERVFISQQAIYYPYFQYDGQEIHIISKGNKNKSYLRNFMEDKELKLVSHDNDYPLLSIYEIELEYSR